MIWLQPWKKVAAYYASKLEEMRQLERLWKAFSARSRK